MHCSRAVLSLCACIVLCCCMVVYVGVAGCDVVVYGGALVSVFVQDVLKVSVPFCSVVRVKCFDNYCFVHIFVL